MTNHYHLTGVDGFITGCVQLPSFDGISTQFNRSNVHGHNVALKLNLPLAHPSLGSKPQYVLCGFTSKGDGI